MKGKMIAIGVLVIVAGIIVYFMLGNNSAATDTTDSTPTGDTPPTPKVIVSQTVWEIGQAVPDGYYQTVDSRTGADVIRPISTR